LPEPGMPISMMLDRLSAMTLFPNWINDCFSYSYIAQYGYVHKNISSATRGRI
jgi:hypothetical protein